jgi:lipid-A-disaccharide synthase
MNRRDASLPIDFYVQRTSEIIEAARCAMMVSGSVSLELMARRTPAAVVYRVGRVLHTIGRLMVRLNSMTLPNLMAGRTVFPEMLSVGRPEPAIDFLTQSVGAMLGDSFYFQQALGQLDALAAQHARPGASARAADCLGAWMGLEPQADDREDAIRWIADSAPPAGQRAA